MTRGSRAAGLVLGVVLDQVLGDPRRGHPVAGFGAAAGALERRVWADCRGAGTAYAAASLLPVLVAGYAAERATARRPLAHAAITAAATWLVLGGRTLRRTALALGEELARTDLASSRALLPALCGRDPSSLDAAGLARATTESVAENTSDAAVAPLWWGAVSGVAGLLGYRAVNTLDAMVGHRSVRYRHFGWACARLDDAANFVPARLTGACTLLVARVVDGRAGDGWRAWRRDAARHPSPNAGVCEAAAAGVLGLQLGGITVYPGVAEDRPLLGDGTAPTAADVSRAVRLSAATQAAALAVAVVLAGARR